ncbi:MAG: hypothetical protein PHQ98_02590 [Candidatus ainarchaeum sp.]|nr:hypothetical protein [Candidatus ainarchaeum sp.]
MVSKRNLFLEESGESSFGSVYMILVFAIAALLLIAIVKPTYQNAAKNIPKTNPTLASTA